MASQAFYRKWRPQTLGEVVGQEQVSRTLLNALKNGRVSHAYLFCGPRGTGKTSTGRILAKAVNCLNNEGKDEPCNTCDVCQAITTGRSLDVIEIDAASNRGIDEIRGLRERVNYAPSQDRFKVYIIDEVHMLTKEASNALLKTLEEPPPYVIFVLATTETHKVLPTIISRCQRFDFRRLSRSDIVQKLTSICTEEKIQIEPEALHLVARAATGSLRDAENLLQQLTTYYGAEIGLTQVQNVLGVTGDSRAKELTAHIVNNDIATGISTINNVNSDGVDLRQFNRELVEYLRLLLLVKTGATDSIDLAREEKDGLKNLAAKVPLPQILKAVKLFGQLDISLDNYATLPLELALVDCILTVDTAVDTKKEIVPSPKPVAPAKITEPIDKPVTEAQSINKPTSSKAPPPEEKKIEVDPAEKPEPKPVLAETEISASLPEAGGDELKHLRNNWRQLIKDAPDGIGRTPAAALLRSARPKSVQGDVVTLSFKYPLHKENMEKLENQKTAEKIIIGVLGRNCRVQCVYEPDNDHLLSAALKIGAQIIDAEEK
ncbi:DNA polymerase III subunit gamma/tau [Chloroflexota bacterium]